MTPSVTGASARADPARRHRRLLRVRRGAEGPSPEGQARHRRRRRTARRRGKRLVRGPRLGVRSAMPGVRARRLCPDAVFLPPDFEAYQAHSNRFREVLLSYTPLVEPISLDEAFLDVGGRHHAVRPARRRSREKIRADVEREVGVTCSVGVAPTKFVAKLASDELQARRAASWCRPTAWPAFLEPLPVGRLWGVGEKTGEISGPARRSAPSGDLGRTPESILGAPARRGARASPHPARPRDGRARVVPYEAPKSVGHEETFERDLDDDEEILRELLRLSGRVAARLRDGRLPGPDGHPEGPAGELHHAHPIADAVRRRPTSGADLVPGRLGAVSGAARARAAASGCWACRPRGLVPAGARAAGHAPRRAGGATSSAPSTGSSGGSAGARPCRRPCWTGERGR